MFFLASNGYRCIAHDRRGHGRSSQPWDGNDMDTYADDLATSSTRSTSGMPCCSASPRGAGKLPVTSAGMAQARQRSGLISAVRR